MNNQYLSYFPEDQYLFNEYRNKYNQIKDELYISYVDVFIKKEKKNKRG